MKSPWGKRSQPESKLNEVEIAQVCDICGVLYSPAHVLSHANRVEAGGNYVVECHQPTNGVQVLARYEIARMTPQLKAEIRAHWHGGVSVVEI